MEIESSTFIAQYSNVLNSFFAPSAAVQFTLRKSNSDFCKWSPEKYCIKNSYNKNILFEWKKIYKNISYLAQVYFDWRKIYFHIMKKEKKKKKDMDTNLFWLNKNVFWCHNNCYFCNISATISLDYLINWIVWKIMENENLSHLQ